MCDVFNMSRAVFNNTVALMDTNNCTNEDGFRRTLMLFVITSPQGKDAAALVDS